MTEHSVVGTMYVVRGDEARVYLTVDEHGLVELWQWSWNGKTDRGAIFRFPEDEERYANYRAVWDWLVEWELVELKAIGPEDSEYFATERLTDG